MVIQKVAHSCAIFNTAEYIAANLASCQAVWLKRLLSDFGYTENEPISILCDSTSAISLSKNNVFHQKRKHIDTRFHFIRELVKNGDISLDFNNDEPLNS